MDYSQMSDAELSREIATRQGWHTYSAYVDSWIMVAPPFKPCTREDYMSLHRGGIKHKTEAETWQDAPDYASDMNAAVELLREIQYGDETVLTYDHNTGLFDCRYDVGLFAVGLHENPARAISIAWLAWHERENGQG